MECAICFELVDVVSTGITTVCGHMFHRRCIRKWLESHTSCPMCRTPVAVIRPDIEQILQGCIEVYDWDYDVRVYAPMYGADNIRDDTDDTTNGITMTDDDMTDDEMTDDDMTDDEMTDDDMDYIPSSSSDDEY